MRQRAILNVVLAAAVLGLAGLGTFLLIRSRKKPQTEQPAKAVPKVRASVMRPIRDYPVRIVGHGSARPRVEVEVVPQVSGEVVWRAGSFRSGKYVARGQELFRIDGTDYVQARDAAERQIELLEANLKRLEQEKANLLASEKLARSRVELAEEQLAKLEKLEKRGAATSNDVDLAQDALLSRREQLQTILNSKALIAPKAGELQAEKAVRRVQLQQAQTALQRTVFQSPVTGRVIRTQLEVGTRVAAGKSYGELYGLDVMELPVPVPASDLQWIDRSLLRPDKDGRTPAEKSKLIRAEVHWFGTESLPGRQAGEPPASWPGYVGRIEAGLEAETRTAKLVVYVDNPPIDSGRMMLDRNMFCRAVIHGKTVAEALIVPRRAILPQGAVYVVADGRLRLRKVTVKRFTDDEAMIFPAPKGNPRPDAAPAEGLRAGELVCTGYVPKPVPGMPVEVIEDEAGGSGAPAAKPATAPSAPAGR